MSFGGRWRNVRQIEMLCARRNFLFGLFVVRTQSTTHAAIKSSTLWMLCKLAKEEEVFHQMVCVLNAVCTYTHALIIEHRMRA